MAAALTTTTPQQPVGSARNRAADMLLADVPGLRKPLLELARAQAALDDAHRELTLASVHTRLRWHELDSIVQKLRYADH